MPKKKEIKIDTTSLGSKFYRVNGLLHRENNLPAVEWFNGDKEFWLNGKLTKRILSTGKIYLFKNNILID